MHKLILATLAVSLAATAQDNPLSTSTRNLYTMAKTNITKAAEKMSDADYAYKPVDSVRSFGQLVGHVADANYMFCSAVLGEKPPVSGIEKSKTTKADLVPALKDSFTYCDKAYDITDAAASEKIKFFGQERPKLNVLNFNNMHDYEHYGNMTTYLRMKGIVPPSSERR